MIDCKIGYFILTVYVCIIHELVTKIISNAAKISFMFSPMYQALR